MTWKILHPAKAKVAKAPLVKARLFRANSSKDFMIGLNLSGPLIDELGWSKAEALMIEVGEAEHAGQILITPDPGGFFSLNVGSRITANSGRLLFRIEGTPNYRTLPVICEHEIIHRDPKNKKALARLIVRLPSAWEREDTKLKNYSYKRKRPAAVDSPPAESPTLVVSDGHPGVPCTAAPPPTDVAKVIVKPDVMDMMVNGLAVDAAGYVVETTPPDKMVIEGEYFAFGGSRVRCSAGILAFVETVIKSDTPATPEDVTAAIAQVTGKPLRVVSRDIQAWLDDTNERIGKCGLVIIKRHGSYQMANKRAKAA